MALKRPWQRSWVSSNRRNFRSVVASGTPVGGQINAGKALEGLAVVEGVFEGFVGQAIPLLEEIDAQHPLQSDGRTSALAFRIEGFDDGEQFRPGNQFLHAREELFAAGDLLLGGKFGLGETRLVRHAWSLGNHAHRVCMIIRKQTD